MRYYLLASTAGLLACLAIQAVSPDVFCRCQPSESCWPSDTEWQRLNLSLDGSLIRLQPIGHVCHSVNLDQTACEEVSRRARDSGWRASRPETLQGWLWEAGASLNESCLIRGPAETFCHRGRLSQFSAAVQSAEDVQKAVLFAQKHRLRLVIKNSGHDGCGRSASPNSFQIHTYLLKDIRYHADFIPRGSTTGSGAAVTVGAGVAQGELYEWGAREGFIIVGGECPTVGAIGGFLQGGGVSSILGQKRGLAVDNVLEFQAVLANGSLVTANSRTHPNLFWALRGGGGGNFAVVTQATLRVYPNEPAVVTRVSVGGSRNDWVFWNKAVVSLLALLRSFNEQNVGGQFLLEPSTSQTVNASLTLYFMNTTSVPAAEEEVRRKLAYLMDGRSGFHSTSSALAQVSSALRMSPDIHTEPEHGIVQGSVLVSYKFFHSPQGPARMAEAFSRITLGPRDILFTSNLGGVVNQVDPESTSMHPAWRSSAQLINYVRYVEPTVDKKSAVLQELNRVQMPILYSLEPESKVSYLNLGDPSDKDFQNVFWGPNYRRLIQIKHQVDPHALFITRLGVGSEEWDDEGRCRKRAARFWSAI
ncbi:hypothetical protein AbraIFM66951_005470 [Aspergillus brasiliensis]|nr:hypothetical protein AbraIFM66951_005470 [Aspergillus brasiliensis]